MTDLWLWKNELCRHLVKKCAKWETSTISCLKSNHSKPHFTPSRTSWRSFLMCLPPMPSTSLFLKTIIQHFSLSGRCQFHTHKNQNPNYSSADSYFSKFLVDWIHFWFVMFVNKYMICFKLLRDLLCLLLCYCTVFFSQRANTANNCFIPQDHSISEASFNSL